MQGFLIKKYSRVTRYSTRYFILKDGSNRIEYFVKEPHQKDGSKEPRGVFEIVRGCCVGAVTEIDAPTQSLKRKGKGVDKVFTFTILWPDNYEPPPKTKKRRQRRRKSNAVRHAVQRTWRLPSATTSTTN